MAAENDQARYPRRRARGDRLTRAFTAPARAVGWIRGADAASGGAGATPEEPAGRDAIVDCAVYVDGQRREVSDHDYRQALAEARQQPGAFVWLGLHAPGAAQMAGIAEAFGLHELAVEDVVAAGQRPKLEQYGDVYFLALRSARFVEHDELTADSEVIDVGQIMMFLGPDFVVTIRHGQACQLTPVRDRLERRPELLRQGPWAVAYGVLDQVVDLYLAAAEGVGQDVDLLEEAVFARASQDDGRMQRFYQLKRELVEFKRAVLPLQRPMTALLAETPGISKELRRYFADVHDHLARVIEQISAYDDLLISIMQARLAQVSVDQNNDMRKIASWAAIAAVWTAIAGVYGMNFHWMPELNWRYGYPLVLGVMVAISFMLYRALRRHGWL